MASGWTEAEHISTDVLIIGAGSAGTRAAIAAAEIGASVVMLAKSPLGKTGITPLIFSGYTAVTPTVAEDSAYQHFEDTVKAGYYLSDQNLVEAMAYDGGQSVVDLERYGVRFKKQKGLSDYILWPRLPGMAHPRTLDVVGGGPSYMYGLNKEVKKHSSIRRMEDVLITRLLKHEDRVVGAVAIHMPTGKAVVFAAKVTLIATGGCEQLFPYSDCPPESTGDGFALALAAGAELVDMEQQLFYPTVAIYPEIVRGLEISYEAYLRPGAKILNGKGQSIVPEGMFPTRAELANMIFDEIAAGRAAEHGGVMIDITGCSDQEKATIVELLPAWKRLMECGVDIREQYLEVVPAAHTTLGGIRINEKGETNIEGLFAGGEAAGNVHGANRLAGNALTDTQVFGARAGTYAAEYALKATSGPIDQGQVNGELERVYGMLSGQGGGARPVELKARLKKIMWDNVGLRRRQDRLEAAIADLQALKDDHFADMRIAVVKEYNYEWFEAIELTLMAEVGQVIAKAGLTREESRGTHYREEYPQQRAEWLKHTLVKLDGANLVAGSAPIVVTKLELPTTGE